jgi:hypothetical protein
MYQSTVHLPTICARCGENPPVTQHVVQERRRSLSPWTLLTMFIGVRVNRNEYIHYTAPLCADCAAKVKSRQTLGRVIMALGLLVTAGAALMLVMGYNNLLPTTGLTSQQIIAHYQALQPQGIAILMGLVIAMIGSRISKISFASVRKGLYKFYNPTYQAAFAQLNPSAVKSA